MSPIRKLVVVSLFLMVAGAAYAQVLELGAGGGVLIVTTALSNQGPVP